MKNLSVSPLAMTLLVAALVVCIILLLAGRVPTADSPEGFVLPPGDPVAGQVAFVDLGCAACHTVNGVDLGEVGPVGDLIVQLGGEVPRKKTYGQLVTEIIHPSEVILQAHSDYTAPEGSSMMPDLTDQMSVRQMADLVSFLQEHYEVVVPDFELPRMYPYTGPYR